MISPRGLNGRSMLSLEAGEGWDTVILPAGQTLRKVGTKVGCALSG